MWETERELDDGEIVVVVVDGVLGVDWELANSVDSTFETLSILVGTFLKKCCYRGCLGLDMLGLTLYICTKKYKVQPVKLQKKCFVSMFKNYFLYKYHPP